MPKNTDILNECLQELIDHCSAFYRRQYEDFVPLEYKEDPNEPSS